MVDILTYMAALLLALVPATLGYCVGILVEQATNADSYEAGVDDTVVVLVDNLEKASTDPDFDPDATYIFLRNAIEKEVDSNAECSSDTGPACG